VALSEESQRKRPEVGTRALEKGNLALHTWGHAGRWRVGVCSRGGGNMDYPKKGRMARERKRFGTSSGSHCGSGSKLRGTGGGQAPKNKLRGQTSMGGEQRNLSDNT